MLHFLYHVKNNNLINVNVTKILPNAELAHDFALGVVAAADVVDRGSEI